MLVDRTKVNCHNYCQYDRCCSADGEIGQNPWMCPNAWRIEDIMAEEYPIDDDIFPKEPEEDEEEDYE